MRSSSLAGRSPLATWVSGETALEWLRRELGRRPLVLTPRDREWRRFTPDWRGCLALASSGLPFHIVAERCYDRSADPRRLRPALASGATVYLPQAHEVLPRVARLMVAIRAQLLGPLREECSFLFLVDGQSREGMGLHHDGPVDAFWVQLAGRRTVTIGPPVRARAAQDLDDDRAERAGPRWRTLDLAPGTLFYLPPFTPHRVLCRGRSLALSLTWRPAPRRSTARARASSLASWAVASGRAVAIPRPSDRLWIQVPVAVEHAARGPVLITPEARLALPQRVAPLVRSLGAMPSLPRSALRGRHRQAVEWLLGRGILGDRDLPIAIEPANPVSLDGWRFA